MKKLFSIALILFLSACSSAPEKAENKTTKNTMEEPNTGIEELATPTTSVEKTKPVEITKPSPAPAKVEPVSETEIDKAIKSLNDEQIKKASTDILMKNPQDIKAINALAMTYYKNGQFTAAQYLLNKANKINDRSVEVLNNMGLVYLSQGETRQAIRSFKKVLEIDPEHALASANLGQIYISNKAYVKATIAYEIATNKGVRDWKTMNNYAISLTATRSFEKAAAIYKEILKTQSSQREVLFNYSILLIDHLERYDQGLELIKKLQFIGPPADTRKKVSELENKAKSALKK